MTNIDSREIVLDILMEVLEKNAYSHVVLNQALNKFQYLEKAERGFISRVVHGTIEYLIQIDYTVNQYSKVKIKKMKPLIRTLLRMSVYQIFYMDRIPDSAVCNEAVKLAEKRRFHGLKSFVNGVLRSIVRNKDQMVWPDLSIQYAVPEWLLSLWKEHYGLEKIEPMLQSFLQPSKLTVRCNRNQTDKKTIIDSLVSQGVIVQESTVVPAVLFLDQIDYLEDLEAFRNGWIQVQDVSSVFVGEAVKPKSGDHVIDVCSAPGGKSLHVADILQETGFVDARDLTEFKVQMIEDNIIRSGMTNIKAVVKDALLNDPESFETADIVIADLPCSGLGILGKKPDIKYNMNPDKLKSLVALQRQILSVVHNYVKPGGKLVYSTCTINPEENEENVKWFLENHPFRAVNIEGRLGNEIQESSMKNGWVQLLPGIHPCDGFFISVFEKNKL